MKRFAQLFRQLDETTKTNAKVESIVAYLREADPSDAAWAIFFLCGRKFRQVVPTRKLRSWAAQVAEIPEWLIDECYATVGDLAETLALLLPPGKSHDDTPLQHWIEQTLIPLRDAAEAEQKRQMLSCWSRLDTQQSFVLHKLMTGAFRVGVSQRLVVRAVAQFAGVDGETITHRLAGEWTPTAEFFAQLVAHDTGDAAASRPYPFFLAQSLERSPAELGPVEDWQAEWKWDGIRGQVIRRKGQVFIWSRGNELVNDQFPELSEAAENLPAGTVIDGEVVVWREGAVQSFAELQRRLGRKRVGKKLLREAPVSFLAFDLLEYREEDIREKPLAERRELLTEVIEEAAQQGPMKRPSARKQLMLFDDEQQADEDDFPFRASPIVEAASWDDLSQLQSAARRFRAEGLMLKRLASRYGTGRTGSDWWKWKVDPFSADAVLTAAQPGSGKRASLYTDYTFSLWDEGALVPFAKAYSGLSNDEISEVDAFVRSNTLERHGPVRTVQPELVFELAFEGIQRSSRHKSGIAVRFPRIARWRRDKTAAEADQLSRVAQLIEQ